MNAAMKPQYSPTVTLGHLLQIVVILLSVGGATIGMLSAVSSKLGAIEARMAAVEKLNDSYSQLQILSTRNALGVNEVQKALDNQRETNEKVLDQLTSIREELSALRAMQGR